MTLCYGDGIKAMLGLEILRLPIQKPYQINVYKAGKRLSIRQLPVD